MANYFITGSGTDIGKTYILTAMCKYLVSKRKTVIALKPLISGWDDKANDIVRILHSLSLPVTEDSINLISLHRFHAPIAPNMAAAQEGIKLEFDDIYKFCIRDKNKYDYLFIEGAGGVMSPLTDHDTYRDLITRLKMPVIFIASIYLGAISHVLSALETLKESVVVAIIINDHRVQDHLSIREVIKCLQCFTDIPVIPYSDNDKIFEQIL